ncbi:MAG TPA: hypothetical protein VGG41_06090 [Solirubrobacteraceae bacterium]
MPENFDRDRVDADQRRLGELLLAVEEPAPGPLRARIAELNAAPSRRRLRLPVLAFGGAFATAAAAVVVILLVVGTSAPTVLRTAKLALARPNASAPTRLVATGTEIVFPDWSRGGWKRAGVRRDRLDGRAVTTEFYGSSTATVGYSIVSGRPLALGSAVHTVRRSHAEYQLLRTGVANVVAWVQDGHSCVIASRSAPAAVLLALAVAQDSSATVSDPIGGSEAQQYATRA